MRLTPFEIKTIKNTAHQVFGERVALWLFGSRVDDSQRGGDIDLYIELPAEDYTYAKKLKFWCELVNYLGEQKIDIVINRLGAAQYLPICQ